MKLKTLSFILFSSILTLTPQGVLAQVYPLKTIDSKLLVETIETAKTIIQKKSEDEIYADFRLYSFDLITSSYADEIETCFYAGWPSHRENHRCVLPVNNLDYVDSQKSCSNSKQIACNPVLFGPSKCAKGGTRAERQTLFSQCENLFNQSKTKYDFIDELKKDEKKLKTLNDTLNLATKICNDESYSQYGTAVCIKLLNKIDQINKIKLDSKTITNDEEKTAKIPKKEIKPSTTSQCDLPNYGANIDKNVKALVPAMNECKQIEDLKSDSKNIENQITDIITQDNDNNPIAPVKTKYNPNAATKGKIFDLSEKKICTDLKLFKLVNHLNFEVNCEKKPYQYPNLKAEFLKNNSDNIDFNKKLREFAAKKVNDLDATIESLTNYSNGNTETLDKIKAEQACWKNEFPKKTDCDGDTQQYDALLARLSDAPKLTYYIEVDGKQIPFKEVSTVLAQFKPGPKVKSGDEMTPEGTFKLKDVNKNSKMFISTTIDYEHWEDRKFLPNSEVNIQNKGGSVEIHGTGGTDGCLSLSNSEAAYMGAFVKNSKQASLSIYPMKLTDENISNATSIPDFSKYKSFWNHLKTQYESDQKKKIEVKTINDIIG